MGICCFQKNTGSKPAAAGAFSGRSTATAKNLSNSVNYMIRQIFRIHTKLKEGKVPEEWEAELMEQVNCGIRDYNEGRAKDRTLRHIDETNGFVADAYFLSWYLKKTAEYKAMPYATCSQICIQEKCREWKAFYRAKAAYAKDASSFAGRPCPPGYLDPSKGRGWLVITSQNFRIDENRNVIMPGFLKGIHIRARHDSVRQIRILTAGDGIVIRLIYENAGRRNKERHGDRLRRRQPDCCRMEFEPAAAGLKRASAEIDEPVL